MHHNIYQVIQSIIRYRFQAMEHQWVKLTHKLKKITELPPRPRTVSIKVAGRCVGMADISKYYFSRAGALRGNGNFIKHAIWQNNHRLNGK